MNLKPFFTIFCTLLLQFFFVESVNAQCLSNRDIVERVSARENGRVDFTIIGGSQNPLENNKVDGLSCGSFAPVLTTSAELDIPTTSTIRSAYLYWSGTGNAIQNVQLNNTSIVADNCWEFDYNQQGSIIPFFSARADITRQIANTGNGTYTFTGLDNTAWYTRYRCAEGGELSLLYGGWSLVVVFEDPSFSYNSVFVFDGFRNFNDDQFDVTIQTNVFNDYLGSHVGFIAWEGDDFISDPNNVDVFRLNGDTLINDANDDPTNVFNGTNSFVTPADYTFYNADIDNFNIDAQVQALLNTEAANFNFYLSSGQDFIILNSLVMRLPNEAPDARVEIPATYTLDCNERSFAIDFDYYNTDNATQELLAGVPITFYLNEVGGTVVGSYSIPIDLSVGSGDSVQNFIINLPNDYIGDFEIIAVIDDPNVSPNSYGQVLEVYEENNESVLTSFVDQDYDDVLVTHSMCEGESVSYKDAAGVTQTVTTAGTYNYAETTVRGGCDSLGILNVIVHPVVDQYFPLEEVCEGDVIIKPDGEQLVLEPRATPYEFEDILQNTYGCDYTAYSSFIVNAHERATIDVTMCEGQGFVVDDTQTVYDAGTYIGIKNGVTATGCDSIITYNVDMLDVLYPNAFGPNGNGVNDGFKALVPEICPDFITEYKLQIFDRWGNLVYQTDDVNAAWNGIVDDELGDSTFYLWSAEYKTGTEILVKKEGGVTLIR